MRRHHAARSCVAAVAGATLLVGGVACAGPAKAERTASPAPSRSTGSTKAAPAPSAGPSAKRTAVTLPPVNGRFDYQIGGAYTPAKDVRIIARDNAEKPVAGKYNICYVNAFQTQPEDMKWWTSTNPDLVLRTARGGFLMDPNWPGEMILDTSTAAKRERIAAIGGAVLARCRAAGFQAVDMDNLDTYSRSEKKLSMAHNIATATLLVNRAHALGLAVGQKNSAELGARGKKTIGFDFAVAESCQVYDECTVYTDVYGANVLEIEYTDTPRSAFTKACARQGKKISVILRDRNLVTPRSKAYRYEHC